MNNKNILILFIILLFTACVPKPLKIKIAEATPKLNVFTYSVQNGGILLGLTKTFTSLKTDGASLSDTTGSSLEFIKNNVLVQHARVMIHYDGKTDTLINLGTGLYTSSGYFTFKDYATYELTVYDSSTQETITASTTLHPMVTIDTIKSSVTISGSDTTINFNYSFYDKKSDENYYMINITNLKTVKNFNLFSGFQMDQKSHLELISDQSTTGTDVAGTDNTLLNGNISFYNNEYDITVKDTVLMSIASIDKKYYEFLSVYKRNGSLLNQLTGEPINLPSNVNNGFGYFSMHLNNYRTISLKK